MNVTISTLVICVKAVMYLLSCNLYNYTFKFFIKCRGVFETQSNIYNGAFLQKQLTAKSHQQWQKSSIVDLRLDFKCVSEVHHQIFMVFQLVHSFFYLRSQCIDLKKQSCIVATGQYLWNNNDIMPFADSFFDII